MREFIESALRPDGDLAGVFEFDGETSYFYLWNSTLKDGKKILASICIDVAPSEIENSEVVIRWDENSKYVGLFFSRKLVAVFDDSGGRFFEGNFSTIPDSLSGVFNSH